MKSHQCNILHCLKAVSASVVWTVWFQFSLLLMIKIPKIDRASNRSMSLSRTRQCAKMAPCHRVHVLSSEQPRRWQKAPTVWCEQTSCAARGPRLALSRKLAGEFRAESWTYEANHTNQTLSHMKVRWTCLLLMQLCAPSLFSVRFNISCWVAPRLCHLLIICPLLPARICVSTPSRKP